MANGVVNLVFSSVRKGNGFSETIGGLKEASSKTEAVNKGFEILASTVGGVGGQMVKLVKGLATGGIWEIGAQAIQWIYGLWQKHKQAVQEAAEAEKKAFADSLTAIDDYRSHIKKCYQASSASSDGKVTVTDGTISAAATYADGNCSAQ